MREDLNSDEHKAFLEELKQFQVPCPWGDLSKGEGLEPYGSEGYKRIPYIPLALEIGSGTRKHEGLVKRMHLAARSVGKLFFSDCYYHGFSGSTLELDITKPEESPFGEYRVHAITSMLVFTYDGAGVNFENEEEELGCAQFLSDLLMPGGIISNVMSDGHFELTLETKFGFNDFEYPKSSGDSIRMIQKPF